jgi:hypothetical protein
VGGDEDQCIGEEVDVMAGMKTRVHITKNVRAYRFKLCELCQFFPSQLALSWRFRQKCETSLSMNAKMRYDYEAMATEL